MIPTPAGLVVLVVLALLDGSFSGVRSGFGRTGLVRHRREDLRNGVRGVVAVVGCALPALALFLVDVVLLGSGITDYRPAAYTLTVVLGPYAVAVLLAMAVYFGVGWEHKYVAMALVLGPFTLLRPWVAGAAAIAAVVQGGDPVVGGVVVLTTVAVLAVEPLLGRLQPAAGIRPGRVTRA